MTAPAARREHSGPGLGRGPGGPEDEEDPRGDLTWGSIPGLAAYAAERFGDREAVVDGPVRLSFSELAARSIQVTRALIAAGIGPGDRVAVWAPNSAPWVLVALGALGAGAVLVPVNTRFKGPEAAYVLRRSRARILYTARGFLGVDYPELLYNEDVPALERIVLVQEESGSIDSATDEVPVFAWGEHLDGADGVVESTDGVVGVPVPEHDARNRWQAVRSSDLSDLIFTSGTTGAPKGVMATHAQSLRAFATWSQIVGLEAGDRYLVVNPFFHTFGYKAGILACLMRGATIVPQPVFDVEQVLATDRVGARHRAPGPAHAVPVAARAPRAPTPRPVQPAAGGDRGGGGAGGARATHGIRARLRDGPHRLWAHRVDRCGHHVPPG